MSTTRTGLASALATLAALVLAATLALAGPAAAAASDDLAVTVTVDRRHVVVDLSEAGRTAALLTYDVVVENRGDGLVPAVDVTVTLPDGRVQRYSAGDLGARGLWRAVVTAAVGPSSPSLVSATATAAAGDGTTAVSAPATTDVVTISAVTIERQPRRTLAAARRVHRHPKGARRG